MVKKEDLLGTWRTYKIQVGDNTRSEDTTNYDQYTFSDNSNFKYQYVRNNVHRADSVTRLWDLRLEKGKPVILVNDEPRYRVVSFDKDFLVLEVERKNLQENPLIYHCARESKWNDLELPEGKY